MKIVFNKSSFEFDGLNVVLSVILLYAAFNNELSFNPFYLDSVWLKGIWIAFLIILFILLILRGILLVIQLKRIFGCLLGSFIGKDICLSSRKEWFDSITEYNKPEVQGNEHAGYVETSQYTSKLSPVRNRWSGSVIPSYW